MEGINVEKISRKVNPSNDDLLDLFEVQFALLCGFRGIDAYGTNSQHDIALACRRDTLIAGHNLAIFQLMGEDQNDK